MKCALLGLSLLSLNCGYRPLSWTPGPYQSIFIAPVACDPIYRKTALRLEQSLLDRWHETTGLKLVRGGSHFDLHLSARLRSYREQVLSTDRDGRTKRLQFFIVLDFKITDRNGSVVWSLPNYTFSDQYELATDLGEVIRDEAVTIQERALRDMSDLVIANFSMAISSREDS